MTPPLLATQLVGVFAAALLVGACSKSEDLNLADDASVKAAFLQQHEASGLSARGLCVVRFDGLSAVVGVGESATDTRFGCSIAGYFTGSSWSAGGLDARKALEAEGWSRADTARKKAIARALLLRTKPGDQIVTKSHPAFGKANRTFTAPGWGALDDGGVRFSGWLRSNAHPMDTTGRDRYYQVVYEISGNGEERFSVTHKFAASPG